MATQKNKTEFNHDNASDETSTSNEKYKSPFEPQVTILSNDAIREIN
jgi:hypothetical protein